MSKDERKYTIGEMAKICNVTKKQLRYYDENEIRVKNRKKWT